MDRDAVCPYLYFTLILVLDLRTDFSVLQYTIVNFIFHLQTAHQVSISTCLYVEAKLIHELKHEEMCPSLTNQDGPSGATLLCIQINNTLLTNSALIQT